MIRKQLRDAKLTTDQGNPERMLPAHGKRGCTPTPLDLY